MWIIVSIWFSLSSVTKSTSYICYKCTFYSHCIYMRQSCMIVYALLRQTSALIGSRNVNEWFLMWRVSALLPAFRGASSPLSPGSYGHANMLQHRQANRELEQAKSCTRSKTEACGSEYLYINIEEGWNIQTCEKRLNRAKQQLYLPKYYKKYLLQHS